MSDHLRSRLVRLALLFALCLVTLAVGRRVWASEELTLERAIELAASNNGQITAAGERVAQAEAAARGAASRLGPRLDATVGVVRYDEAPVSAVFRNGLPTGDYVVSGFKETWQAALKLSQILYSGGTLQSGLSAARLEVDAYRAEERRTVQTVFNGVSRAYFSLQQARAALEVAEEAVNLAEEHRKDADSLYRNGLVAKNELLRAQVSLSDAELNRIRATNAVEVARKALERAIGLALGAEWSLPAPQMELPSFTLPAVAEAESEALVERAELKALAAARAAAEMTARAAAGQARPQLVLEAQASDVGDSFYPNQHDSWQVTLAAQWRLYDSGEIKADVDRARGVAKEVLARTEDMERQVLLEVATARLDLDSALQRYRVAVDQVALAEEDHRMALRRYKAQVGTNLDVLDAQVALTNARTQLVQAVYDAFKADADLVFAIGRDDVSADGKGDAPRS